MTSGRSEQRTTVIVTSRSFGSGGADPAGLLEDAGLEVVRADPGHDLEALTGPLAEAVAWIAGNAPVEGRHLDMAPRLKILARYGAGVDSVDVAAASERDIVVTNTPGANTEAVADHTIGLMLAALRHVVQGDRAVRKGEHPSLRGREFGSLTIGLVGFGNIGRALTRRLKGGFGSRVLTYDPYVPPERVEEAGAEPVDSLSDLVSVVDVLSLHLPGGAGALIDRSLLDKVRAGAVLVNTARGDLLDETAVADALTEGRLGAAALDVLASEPATENPLLGAPNTVVTPHIAAQTTEAIDRMGMGAAEEVIRVISGEEPHNRVSPPS